MVFCSSVYNSFTSHGLVVTGQPGEEGVAQRLGQDALEGTDAPLASEEPLFLAGAVEASATGYLEALLDRLTPVTLGGTLVEHHVADDDVGAGQERVAFDVEA